MLKCVAAIVFVAMVIGLVTVTYGQQTDGVEFVRGGIGGARRVTTYTGRADRREDVGGVTTYRGNVSIFFEGSNLIVRADEVTYAEDSSQLTISGNVRLALDAPAP